MTRRSYTETTRKKLLLLYLKFIPPANKQIISALPIKQNRYKAVSHISLGNVNRNAVINIPKLIFCDRGIGGGVKL